MKFNSLLLGLFLALDPAGLLPSSAAPLFQDRVASVLVALRERMDHLSWFSVDAGEQYQREAAEIDMQLESHLETHPRDASAWTLRARLLEWRECWYDAHLAHRRAAALRYAATNSEEWLLASESLLCSAIAVQQSCPPPEDCFPEWMDWDNRVASAHADLFLALDLTARIHERFALASPRARSFRRVLLYQGICWEHGYLRFSPLALQLAETGNREFPEAPELWVERGRFEVLRAPEAAEVVLTCALQCAPIRNEDRVAIAKCLLDALAYYRRPGVLFGMRWDPEMLENSCWEILVFASTAKRLAESCLSSRPEDPELMVLLGRASAMLPVPEEQEPRPR